MNVLSLGLGVQSSTMALMASEGWITPLPDFAVFADTGWEPPWVYEWLKEIRGKLSFPIHVVRREPSLLDSLISQTGARFASLPLFVEGGGMLRRQCTREFKIEPIEKELRRRAGLLPRQRWGKRKQVSLWIGISTDEIIRMKPNRRKWIENRWPLIEERMSRTDCLKWLSDRGFPIPGKSSCVGCPYHDDGMWRNIQQNHPAVFAEAASIDARIRNLPRIKKRTFLHRSLKPLGEIDFSEKNWPLFGEECEGICGV